MPGINIYYLRQQAHHKHPLGLVLYQTDVKAVERASGTAGLGELGLNNYWKWKYNLYMRYEGGPMNSFVCSGWQVPKRRKC